MYGTADESGREASAPPRCPACQGKTYFVDPEQTVMTCYDCGRYFRRKKPEAGKEPAEAPSPPEAPPPPKVAEPEPPRRQVPAPPAYTPPPPPPPPPATPKPPAGEEPADTSAEEEEGDFDLVLGGESPKPEAEEGEDVHCSVCGFPMQTEWKVCPNCVSRYETSCGSCGKTLSAWWLICPWCEAPKQPDQIHVGQRR